MFELRVISRFAAAHQLKMVAAQCENLHGHNWKVEVYLKGEKLNQAGVLIDFGVVKEHLKEIVGRLDHTFLNELETFSDATPPSSENISYHIAVELQKAIAATALQVARVTTWESDDASATYIPPPLA